MFPHKSREGDGPEPGFVFAGSLVGQTLWSLGVRQAFGVVGSGNFVATAALVSAGARYVAARHEGGAVTMAANYTRVSGELAVCSVHQGPGLTNSLTGLVDAAKSRTPLVIIAGATSSGATSSNFYIDQAGIVERTGAIAEQLYRPESVVVDTVRAVQRALSEHRPVVLNMPLDVQATLVAQPASLPTLVGLPKGPRPAFGEAARIAELLANAKRPLILAGRGAWASYARRPLIQLGDAVGALFANTAVANGFFADSPWTLGISGGFASDKTADIIAQADVVIGFGCSFTVWTTRSGRIVNPDAVVVQVDTDPLAIMHNARADFGVVADAAEAARDVLSELGGTSVGRGWRTEDVATSIHEARAHSPLPENDSSNGCILPEVLSRALETMLPAERTVVIDGGHFIGWPATCWSVPDPDGFVFTSSWFQAIGLGLAGAIGAELARPERFTVLAAGDGGFLMSVSELETLARLQLPILVVVYNDAAYSAEVHHFVGMGAPLDIVKFPDTDIAAIARAAGAHAVTVRCRADLELITTWLENPVGPMVVDAKIDPSVVGYWAGQDFQGH